MTDEEKRAYQKGYAAGKKYCDRQVSREEYLKEISDFKKQAFCAALTGLIAVNGWQKGDKPWRTIPEYVDGAWDFADEAVKQRRW